MIKRFRWVSFAETMRSSLEGLKVGCKTNVGHRTSIQALYMAPHL